MGRLDYFHRDGEAERRRIEQMNSEDWDVVVKGYRNWIRHEVAHVNEYKEMISYSEELIEMRKKEMFAIQSLIDKRKLRGIKNE